jgi:hypothetical protein
MRYKPTSDGSGIIHDFKYISESDLVFLMVNHGHTVYFEFLKNMRENPYTLSDIYHMENEVAVVLWSE